jgi:ligand-binding sensor domain-containing protein
MRGLATARREREISGWKWLAFGLFWLAAAWCLQGSAAPRSLRFERLGLEQGLSQESVLSVLQDRAGFIWIGTQAGLNRYDGYKVKVFRNDPLDRTSLVDNYVMASFEDSAGRLWFGTKGGLTRFDPERQCFERYPAPATILQSNQVVLAITGDRAGGMWLGTADGLKHFDPATGQFREYRHNKDDPGSLSDDRVNDVALDPQGALWVATSDGVNQLAPGAHSFTRYRVGILSTDRKRNDVTALSMGPRGTLWVGTASGLESWRLGGAEPERHRLGLDDGIGEARIRTLYHDSGDTLWVGTDTEGLKWRA